MLNQLLKDDEMGFDGYEGSLLTKREEDWVSCKRKTLEKAQRAEGSWPYVANALEKQVGGDHYKGFIIQPAEFCHKNNIGYLEATAIKYLCRWKLKGGIQDLDKAIHFIELLKELETK